MYDNYLTIALSKGSLLQPTLKIFEKLRLPCEGIDDESRSMVFTYDKERVKYIMCRPTDVPTYVAAYGSRPMVWDETAKVLVGKSRAAGRLPVTIPTALK